MADEQWYYSEGGQQRGPVNLDSLRQLAATGRVQAQDLVWRDGMANWLPLSSVPELGMSAPQYAAPPGYAPAGAPGYAAPGMGGVGYYNPNAPTDGNTTNYAGFWMRFGAWIIDYLVLLIPNYALNFALGLTIPAFTPPAAGTAGGGLTPAQMTAFFSVVLGSLAVSMSLGWLYYALMESSAKQGTLGKMAVGLKVTDLDGKRISFGRASGRFFAKLLSGLICAVGYMMAGWTEKKQALHDQLASTLVLRKD